MRKGFNESMKVSWYLRIQNNQSVFRKGENKMRTHKNQLL